MSAGIEALIVHAAGEKRFTRDLAATYGYRLDDRDVDVDMAGRINDMAHEGLLDVNWDADGSRVTVTGAGWAAIA